MRELSLVNKLVSRTRHLDLFDFSLTDGELMEVADALKGNLSVEAVFLGGGSGLPPRGLKKVLDALAVNVGVKYVHVSGVNLTEDAEKIVHSFEPNRPDLVVEFRGVRRVFVP